MTEPSIRLATAADLPALGAMESSWGKEEISWGFNAATEEQLTKAIQTGCYVAEADGVIVGYASICLHSGEGLELAVVPKGNRYLVLDNLYVLPAHRDAGLGRRLMDAVEARGRQEGATAILVYSATKDTHRIMRFYEGCGFTTWFVQMFKELN